MRALTKTVLFVVLLVTAYWLGLNVIYAVRYITGVDVGGLARYAPYISQVDISVANTLIFFLTALYVCQGTRKYYGNESAAKQLWTPDFPFPKGFKTLLIQLGLLGTIFAFIIAFNRLAGTSASTDAQHKYDPALLIVPLGAALWSTFTGVGFAFVVVPLIQKVFMRFTGGGPGESVHDVNTLSAAISGLQVQTRGTATSIGEMSHEIEQLANQIRGLRSNWGSAVSLLETLASSAQAIAGSLAALPKLGADLVTSLGLLNQTTADLKHQIGTNNTQTATLVAQAVQQTQAGQSLSNRLSELATVVQVMSQLTSELTAVTRELKAELHTGTLKNQELIARMDSLNQSQQIAANAIVQASTKVNGGFHPLGSLTTAVRAMFHGKDRNGRAS